MHLLNKLLLTSALVVSFASHSYAMSWEEEFDKFQKSHAVPLQNALKSITEHKDLYLTPQMKTTSAKEQDQAIKLFAVWQVFCDETGLKAEGIDKWIVSSGYKNFPNPKSDSAEVRAFSNYYRGTVEEFRILTKETKAFSNAGFELIQQSELSPLTFLERVKVSLGILNKAASISNKLPPSVKIWAANFKPEDIKSLSLRLEDFLEQDHFTLTVLNKAYDLFNKAKVINFNAYTDEILKSIDLEGHEEWRKDPSVKGKIQEILDENFGK